MNKKHKTEKAENKALPATDATDAELKEVVGGLFSITLISRVGPLMKHRT